MIGGSLDIRREVVFPPFSLFAHLAFSYALEAGPKPGTNHPIWVMTGAYSIHYQLKHAPICKPPIMGIVQIFW
jgi:hypothetical protein